MKIEKKKKEFSLKLFHQKTFNKPDILRACKALNVGDKGYQKLIKSIGKCDDLNEFLMGLLIVTVYGAIRWMSLSTHLRCMHQLRPMTFADCWILKLGDGSQ